MTAVVGWLEGEHLNSEARMARVVIVGVECGRVGNQVLSISILRYCAWPRHLFVHLVSAALGNACGLIKR